MFPKKIERKTIYESEWVNLYVDKVKMPSGEIVEKYHQIDYPKESVTVLLKNQKNKICFIESLRYTTQKVEIEVPSGWADAGEDITATAIRETKEETGYDIENIEHVLTYNPSNGLSNQVVHIFFATINDKVPVDFDKNEVKKVVWLSVEEVKGLIKNGDFNCGVSMMPILLYLSNIFNKE